MKKIDKNEARHILQNIIKDECHNTNIILEK